MSCWPERFEADRAHLRCGRVPDARLDHRGRRRGAGGVAPPQPHRHERRRQPERLADDRHRAGVPRHAALPHVAARGAARPARARPDRDAARASGHRPRAGGGAGGLRRARAPRRARDACDPPSGWPSSCTTCSRCPSTRSLRSWTARPTAARQLASRARRRVQGGGAVPDPDIARQREVVDAFFDAVASTATSTRSSRCSIPTSCCAPTEGRCGRELPACGGARSRSPPAR